MDATTYAVFLVLLLIGSARRSHTFAPRTTIRRPQVSQQRSSTTSTKTCTLITQLHVVSRSPLRTSSTQSDDQILETKKKKKKKKKIVPPSDSSANANVVKQRVKRKYTRKRTIPETERRLFEAKEQWQADYERIMKNAAVMGERGPSIWSFESLFPEPVLDEASIRRDLYGVRERDAKTELERTNKAKGPTATSSSTTTKITDTASTSMDAEAQVMDQLSSATKMKSSLYGGPSMMRLWRERRLGSAYLPNNDESLRNILKNDPKESIRPKLEEQQSKRQQQKPKSRNNSSITLDSIFAAATAALDVTNSQNTSASATNIKVDYDLTRMVEYSMYGYRRTRNGGYQYETSLAGDGAIKFRDGVRLGKPLRVNADRLTYHAKKQLQHGRVEEAQELYEQAIAIDPQDGRAYLGLSRCAERRRDFPLAREFLRAGIAYSSTVVDVDGIEDRGANPFLLQALGCLEEKMGHLSEAEALYVSATKSRPWHAAAWVALAQLRTRKLGQSAEAGRVLFQAAERELSRAGQRQSSHVYTAWASLEYHKAGDLRRARELCNAAIEIDRKCSAAHLQLGVMEAESGNWDAAQKCFDDVLKFDPRNSRVLQAYAIMETKRPGGNRQSAIDLFERALKANSRDGGALQAYALYVASLGDVEQARKLLSRATEVDKRHSAAWQAWGVLEMNQGNTEQARIIFQQGIWACAQLGGGQSGGYRCARLWQAWGRLEALEGDHAAARRCFSRALDADNRNVATVTAWALMEEGLGNIAHARSIIERALKQFAAGSEAKNGLWRTFELMEVRQGNMLEAQRVYQRSMRETLEKADIDHVNYSSPVSLRDESRSKQPPRRVAKDSAVSSSSSPEVEIVRWDGDYSSTSLRGEVWMNERANESKDSDSEETKTKNKNRKR
ncbi:hypothetical protein ACA910_003055 [Epithemia clementina (nom. ined.)]